MCSGVQMLTSQGWCCKGTLNVSLSASWITDLLLGKSPKSSLSQNSHLRQWAHGSCLIINWAPAVVWHSVNWVMVTAPESLPSTPETKTQQGWEDNEAAWAGAGLPDLALHFGLKMFLKGRGSTANTTGHYCAVKGRFWCELLLTCSFVVLFSSKAKKQMKSLLCPLFLRRFMALMEWQLLAAERSCFALSCCRIFQSEDKLLSGWPSLGF